MCNPKAQFNVTINYLNNFADLYMKKNASGRRNNKSAKNCLGEDLYPN
jgi:hypothetical protein